MSGKYLLDTNVVIALFANETAVQDKLGQADQVFVPSIALGELYFGARKSAKTDENLKRIDEFAVAVAVLGCGAETARRYGEIKNALRVKGHPIPENDIWIAAIALENNLTLATRDAHFSEIENLAVMTW